MVCRMGLTQTRDMQPELDLPTRAYVAFDISDNDLPNDIIFNHKRLYVGELYPLPYNLCMSESLIVYVMSSHEYFVYALIEIYKNKAFKIIELLNGTHRTGPHYSTGLKPYCLDVTFKNGLIHSYNDQPAIQSDSLNIWYKYGRVHRDGCKHANNHWGTYYVHDTSHNPYGQYQHSRVTSKLGRYDGYFKNHNETSALIIKKGEYDVAYKMLRHEYHMVCKLSTLKFITAGS